MNLNYIEVKDYLKNLPKFIPEKVMSGKNPYDLESIKNLLDMAGNPEQCLKFIHVAGNNGKGSTIAFLDSILNHSKIRCGCFRTSQIIEYTETISFCGKEISREEYAVAMTDIINIGEKMKSSGLQPPSEFELMLGAALMYFKESDAEIVILEEGSGGYQDATNVIPAPMMTIFVPIGIDHVDEFGDTLSEMITEKACIIKKGTTVISAGQPIEVENILRKKAHENSAHYFTAPHPGHIFFDDEKMVQSFRIMRNTVLEEKFRSYDTDARKKYRERLYQDTIFSNENHIDVNKPGTIEYAEMTENWDKQKKLAQALFASVIDTRMLGIFQAENATVSAITAVSLNNFGYNVTMDAIKTGLYDARWPARFEILSNKPLFICDSAHDIIGVRTLLKSVREYFNNRKVHYIVGILRDKKQRDILGLLMDTAIDFRTVPVDSPRTISADDLCSEITKMGGKATSFYTIGSAIDDAIAGCRENEMIISLGSLYNAGKVRKEIKNRLDR